MQEAANIVTQVGFPIAMCIYLAYFQHKTMKEFTTTLSAVSASLSSMHKRVDTVCEDINSLERHTTAIDTKLDDRLVK